MVTKVTRVFEYQGNGTLVGELQLLTGLKDGDTMLRTECGKFQSEARADAIPDRGIQLHWNSLAGQLEFDSDLLAW